MRAVHPTALSCKPEIAKMTSFLSFHAVAAARGDGLRAELLALRLDVGAPYCERMPRRDGMTQSGPDPVPGETAAKPATLVAAANSSAGLGPIVSLSVRNA